MLITKFIVIGVLMVTLYKTMRGNDDEPVQPEAHSHNTDRK